jgi:Concanavalin A-like lectin/glucanases superfamily
MTLFPSFKSLVWNNCHWTWTLIFLFNPVSWQKDNSVNLRTGLIACYSFSGSSDDLSGNKQHGQIMGAVSARDRFGKPDAALYFNGSAYVSLPAKTLKNNSYTYSVWVKPYALPSKNEVASVFSIGDETRRHQTINISNVYGANGAVGWNIGGYNMATFGVTETANGELPGTNQWYHIVSVRSDRFMSLYINGQLVKKEPTSNTLPYYGDPTKAIIGMRCNLKQSFQGTIDDFCIYNRAISDVEVKKLFTDGLPCAP